MTELAQPDSEHDARLAWIQAARRLHRNKRIAGMAGIVLGASIVAWWRYDAGAPDWALSAGFAILAASWALMVYVIVSRWLWVKRNPYRPRG